MNEHGLPEMTPEIIQEAQDVMARVRAFGIKLGISHLNVNIMNWSKSDVILFGKTEQDEKGHDAGFWSLDIYSDGDTREKYLEFSHDDEDNEEESEEGEGHVNNGND